MTCPSCGGAAHPSSGCQYSEAIVVCGPCTRRFWSWALQHINGKGKSKHRPSPNPYEHIGVSESEPRQ